MPKYFVATRQIGERVDSGNLHIPPEVIHHLKKVLRVRIGEQVIFCDAASTDYHCKIATLEPFSVTIETTAAAPEPAYKVTLYQSLLKADKLDWLVQKAVELGVFEIIPVQTEFSVKKNCNIARLQKIAESAAGQSMRGIIPKVQNVQNWEMAVAQAAKAEMAIIAYEKAEDFSIKNAIESWGEVGNAENSENFENFENSNNAANSQNSNNATNSQNLKNSNKKPQKIALWIGPEGGFSGQEVEFVRQNGFFVVSLGKRVLRAETAGLAALVELGLGLG
ncbi:MAG: 16S rRNA (uracil(1498)-N(3))-methyltransferase [Defluviitaleaceae bacterium]|nr:16S rRNA (uracil(1498)-N(3))-methyltransferase [Defluviitaleaceae bacterium]